MVTKFTLLASLLDDFYDNYSTAEESTIFTTAIERFVQQPSSSSNNITKELTNISTTCA